MEYSSFGVPNLSDHMVRRARTGDTVLVVERRQVGPKHCRSRWEEKGQRRQKTKYIGPRWPEPTESICLPADKNCSLCARTKPFKVGDVLERYLPIIWKRRKKKIIIKKKKRLNKHRNHGRRTLYADDKKKLPPAITGFQFRHKSNAAFQKS